MKELVEVIAKALVDHPEEVSVNEKNEGRTIVLELMSQKAIWEK